MYWKPAPTGDIKRGTDSQWFCPRGISDLLARVSEARRESPTGAVWLRGLSNEKYELLPSIGREQRFAGRNKPFDDNIEKHILHRFRRHAYQFFDRELTDWEALFVARHHGLPVRLLDWTSNPLVAMYFACEFSDSDDVPPNGKIWLLIPTANAKNCIDVFGAHSHPDEFGEYRHPFDVKGVRLVYPMAVAPRINAQSGLFTIQENPSTPLEKLNPRQYDETDLDILRMIELAVPAAQRDKTLKDLNDIGISKRTLFPDLDGLAAGLVSEEILRS